MSQDKGLTCVSDVMSQNFDVVDGLITVAEAIKVFKQKQVGALIIDKRNENDEYGFLLLSDIAKKVIGKDKSPERVNVYEIMAKPVVYVSPDMQTKYCARLFERFGINKAPVIKGGKILGLVGYNDMVLNALV